MLKKILSVSGKPGLYKLISYGKNLIVIEGIADGKRIPAYNHDKIISLGDIAIYTDSAEVPLSKVFESIFAKFEGKAIDVADYNKVDALQAFFSEILPDYDKERVYKNDIKKIILWYNLLVNAGITDFSSEAKAEEEVPEEKEN